MKSIYIIGFYFMAGLSVFGQTKISGVVSDARNQPIAFANVFLKDSYDGASSDEHGNFSFVTSEHGNQILLVTIIGYDPFQQQINLQTGDYRINVTLQDAVSDLETVTISAGTFSASDEGRRTIFRALDIATADIAGALNTLPGTQKVGESGRLFVRGGDSNEARTFIDGVVVLDAYNTTAPNTPSRGRFLPFMFKGTSFSTGGYSAEYGQALSSALILDSKDESNGSQTDIGILSVGADVAHTQAWDRGSAAAKVQYTNLRPYVGFIKQNIDWVDAPASIEAVGALRQKVGKAGMFKAYSNFNRSNFALDAQDIDEPSLRHRYALKNDYNYINTSYRTALNANWLMRSGVSYTAIQNHITFGKDENDEVQKGVHAKAVFEGSVTDAVELKTGMEVINRSYAYGSKSFDETIAAGFVESDVRLANNFLARIGTRVENNTLSKIFSVDPRLALSYRTGINGQVSLAYGVFRQTPANNIVRINSTLRAEKAHHFIASYQYIVDNRTVRLEGYYKKYTDLVKFSNGVPTNEGYGYARGIEFFWRDKKSLKKLDYWISYSFLDTKRLYLNYPIEAMPTFASRHNGSLVIKYFVSKMKSQIGTTFSIASGRPYNNPNEAKFNNGRTPSYQDVSLNWSYLPKPYLILYFSCTNLTGHKNIFGYEYSNVMNKDGQYNGRPIGQPAPRFLFVGIFITIAKDKTINQLPSL